MSKEKIGMIISKGKMKIELEEDIDKLNMEIAELTKVSKELRDSSVYKLLYGKTQMVGEEKNSVRARLEHSQNISQIAQSIISGIYDECATKEQKESMVFKLNKAKELIYTNICALAHDIGHAPFGHNGERSINSFMQKIDDKEQINSIIQKRIECFGEEYEEAQGHIGEDVTLSFEHNEQSALIFYDLMHDGEINLDIVDEKRIINAILAHSTTRVTEPPKDLIAQVIRHTDKIEYRNMDFNEIGKYIRQDNFRNKEYAERKSEERIDIIKENLIKEAIEKGRIDDNMETLEKLQEFRKDYEEAIYFLDEGRKGLLTSENVERNRIIVSKLLDYYYENPDEISTKYFSYVAPINLDVERKIHSVYDNLKKDNITKVESVVNFILSLDDKRAEKKYLKLVKQRIVTGKGIEPITPKEMENIRTEQEDERIEQWRSKEFTRSSQPHTIPEIRNIIRVKDAKFMNEMILPEGKEIIEATKRKIAEDEKLDRALCEQMDKADIARKYNRENIKPETIDEIMGVDLKAVEERKRRRMIELKENWKQPSSPKNKTEGEER
jgi:dGTP triphosphohydrolase